MGRIFAGIAFALAMAVAGQWSTTALAGAPPHACFPPPDSEYGSPPATLTYTYVSVYAAPKYPSGYTSESCGDATRGMLLYGHDVGPLGRAWKCDGCHLAVFDDTTGGTPQILLRGAPRNPKYIADNLPIAPGAAIWSAMATVDCGISPPGIPPGHCLADREPGNVMGDIGDIAEFLHTCNVGIAPCVTGGGGATPGELQGSGAMAFGSRPIGSTSAPLKLTLTNIGSGTVNISGVTNSNAADFTIAANTCTVLSQSASCSISVTFHPSAAGARSASVTVTSDGQFSPQAFTFTGTGIAGGGTNYEGLWWNASESGWGINFEHQANTIFATWFTYDTAGKAWWLVMTADGGAGNTFTGTLYKTAGSSYGASTFVAGTPVAVGTGTLTFTDATHATFDSVVNGTQQTKSITPQVFGPLPTCTYSAAANLTAATNYQGLWWNASESGWGINFAHQGNTIFATWFTFDADGTPLWLVATLDKGAGESFSGKLYRETATPFGATPFVANPPVDVGTATLTFANGNSASFAYTIGSVTKTKALTHQPLAAGGTVCN